MLQALQQPRRSEILRMLWNRELSAGELHRRIGDVTFGAVSQHLRVLRDAGLVQVRPEGRCRYYRANRARLGALGEWLEQMWTGALDELASLAEAEESHA